MKKHLIILDNVKNKEFIENSLNSDIKIVNFTNDPIFLDGESIILFHNDYTNELIDKISKIKCDSITLLGCSSNKFSNLFENVKKSYDYNLGNGVWDETLIGENNYFNENILNYPFILGVNPFNQISIAYDVATDPLAYVRYNRIYKYILPEVDSTNFQGNMLAQNIDCQINQDGKTYTYTLLSNITWTQNLISNGKSVQPSDIIYASSNIPQYLTMQGTIGYQYDSTFKTNQGNLPVPNMYCFILNEGDVFNGNGYTITVNSNTCGLFFINYIGINPVSYDIPNYLLIQNNVLSICHINNLFVNISSGYKVLDYCGGIVQSNCAGFIINNCGLSGNIGKYAGGICGSFCTFNSIKTCSFNGAIDDYGGGIAGIFYGNHQSYAGFSKIEQCYSKCSLGNYSGCICGSYTNNFNYGIGYDAILISNCYSITSTSGIYSGGICGAYTGLSITKNYSNSLNSVNGILSYNDNTLNTPVGTANANVTIYNCYTINTTGNPTLPICDITLNIDKTLNNILISKYLMKILVYFYSLSKSQYVSFNQDYLLNIFNGLLKNTTIYCNALNCFTNYSTGTNKSSILSANGDIYPPLSAPKSLFNQIGGTIIALPTKGGSKANPTNFTVDPNIGLSAAIPYVSSLSNNWKVNTGLSTNNFALYFDVKSTVWTALSKTTLYPLINSFSLPPWNRGYYKFDGTPLFLFKIDDLYKLSLLNNLTLDNYLRINDSREIVYKNNNFYLNTDLIVRNLRNSSDFNIFLKNNENFYGQNNSIYIYNGSGTDYFHHTGLFSTYPSQTNFTNTIQDVTLHSVAIFGGIFNNINNTQFTNLTFTNCTHVGDIIGATAHNVGGIYSSNTQSSITPTTNYCANVIFDHCKIHANNITSGAGGLISNNTICSNITISNCNIDTETIGKIGTLLNGSGGLIGTSCSFTGISNITDVMINNFIIKNGSGGLIGANANINSNTSALNIQNSTIMDVIIYSPSGGLIGMYATTTSTTSNIVINQSCCINGAIVDDLDYPNGTFGGGGIIGYGSTGYGLIKIMDCYTNVDINATGSGGIVGGLSCVPLTIVDSYTLGQINGNIAGGILGSNCGSKSQQTNLIRCYSTAGYSGLNLLTTGITGSAGSGGLYGSHSRYINIINCYTLLDYPFRSYINVPYITPYVGGFNLDNNIYPNSFDFSTYSGITGFIQNSLSSWSAKANKGISGAGAGTTLSYPYLLSFSSPDSTWNFNIQNYFSVPSLFDTISTYFQNNDISRLIQQGHFSNQISYTPNSSGIGGSYKLLDDIYWGDGCGTVYFNLGNYIAGTDKYITLTDFDVFDGQGYSIYIGGEVASTNNISNGIFKTVMLNSPTISDSFNSIYGSPSMATVLYKGATFNSFDSYNINDDYPSIPIIKNLVIYSTVNEYSGGFLRNGSNVFHISNCVHIGDILEGGGGFYGSNQPNINATYNYNSNGKYYNIDYQQPFPSYTDNHQTDDYSFDNVFVTPTIDYSVKNIFDISSSDIVKKLLANLTITLQQIDHCKSYGDVNAYGGGICGRWQGGTKSNLSQLIINNCQQYGNTYTYQDGNISSGIIKKDAGGIIGANAQNITFIISNCNSSGDIIYGGGGIVGAFFTPRKIDSSTPANFIGSSILNCFSKGAIGTFSGGIMGRDSVLGDNSTCLIVFCYSIGNFTGFFSGGICGFHCGGFKYNGHINTYLIISNCYSYADPRTLFDSSIPFRFNASIVFTASTLNPLIYSDSDVTYGSTIIVSKCGAVFYEKNQIAYNTIFEFDQDSYSFYNLTADFLSDIYDSLNCSVSPYFCGPFGKPSKTNSPVDSRPAYHMIVIYVAYISQFVNMSLVNTKFSLYQHINKIFTYGRNFDMNSSLQITSGITGYINYNVISSSNIFPSSLNCVTIISPFNFLTKLSNISTQQYLSMINSSISCAISQLAPAPSKNSDINCYYPQIFPFVDGVIFYINYIKNSIINSHQIGATGNIFPIAPINGNNNLSTNYSQFNVYNDPNTYTKYIIGNYNNILDLASNIDNAVSSISSLGDSLISNVSNNNAVLVSSSDPNFDLIVNRFISILRFYFVNNYNYKGDETGIKFMSLTNNLLNGLPYLPDNFDMFFNHYTYNNILYTPLQNVSVNSSSLYTPEELANLQDNNGIYYTGSTGNSRVTYNFPFTNDKSSIMIYGCTFSITQNYVNISLDTFNLLYNFYNALAYLYISDYRFDGYYNVQNIKLMQIFEPFILIDQYNLFNFKNIHGNINQYSINNILNSKDDDINNLFNNVSVNNNENITQYLYNLKISTFNGFTLSAIYNNISSLKHESKIYSTIGITTQTYYSYNSKDPTNSTNSAQKVFEIFLPVSSDQLSIIKLVYFEIIYKIYLLQYYNTSGNPILVNIINDMNYEINKQQKTTYNYSSVSSCYKYYSLEQGMTISNMKDYIQLLDILALSLLQCFMNDDIAVSFHKDIIYNIDIFNPAYINGVFLDVYNNLLSCVNIVENDNIDQDVLLSNLSINNFFIVDEIKQIYCSDNTNNPDYSIQLFNYMNYINSANICKNIYFDNISYNKIVRIADNYISKNSFISMKKWINFRAVLINTSIINYEDPTQLSQLYLYGLSLVNNSQNNVSSSQYYINYLILNDDNAIQIPRNENINLNDVVTLVLQIIYAYSNSVSNSNNIIATIYYYLNIFIPISLISSVCTPFIALIKQMFSSNVTYNFSSQIDTKFEMLKTSFNIVSPVYNDPIPCIDSDIIYPNNLSGNTPDYIGDTFNNISKNYLISNKYSTHKNITTSYNFKKIANIYVSMINLINNFIKNYDTYLNTTSDPELNPLTAIAYAYIQQFVSLENSSKLLSIHKILLNYIPTSINFSDAFNNLNYILNSSCNNPIILDLMNEINYTQNISEKLCFDYLIQLVILDFNISRPLTNINTIINYFFLSYDFPVSKTLIYLIAYNTLENYNSDPFNNFNKDPLYSSLSSGLSNDPIIDTKYINGFYNYYISLFNLKKKFNNNNLATDFSITNLSCSKLISCYINLMIYSEVLLINYNSNSLSQNTNSNMIKSFAFSFLSQYIAQTWDSYINCYEVHTYLSKINSITINSNTYSNWNLINNNGQTGIDMNFSRYNSAVSFSGANNSVFLTEYKNKLSDINSNTGLANYNTLVNLSTACDSLNYLSKTIFNGDNFNQQYLNLNNLYTNKQSDIYYFALNGYKDTDPIIYQQNVINPIGAVFFNINEAVYKNISHAGSTSNHFITSLNTNVIEGDIKQTINNIFGKNNGATYNYLLKSSVVDERFEKYYKNIVAFSMFNVTYKKLLSDVATDLTSIYLDDDTLGNLNYNSSIIRNLLPTKLYSKVSVQINEIGKSIYYSQYFSKAYENIDSLTISPLQFFNLPISLGITDLDTINAINNTNAFFYSQGQNMTLYPYGTSRITGLVYAIASLSTVYTVAFTVYKIKAWQKSLSQMKLPTSFVNPLYNPHTGLTVNEAYESFSSELEVVNNSNNKKLMAMNRERFGTNAIYDEIGTEAIGKTRDGGYMTIKSGGVSVPTYIEVEPSRRVSGMKPPTTISEQIDVARELADDEKNGYIEVYHDKQVVFEEYLGERVGGVGIDPFTRGAYEEQFQKYLKTNYMEPIQETETIRESNIVNEGAAKEANITQVKTAPIASETALNVDEEYNKILRDVLNYRSPPVGPNDPPPKPYKTSSEMIRFFDEETTTSNGQTSKVLRLIPSQQTIGQQYYGPKTEVAQAGDIKNNIKLIIESASDNSSYRYAVVAENGDIYAVSKKSVTNPVIEEIKANSENRVVNAYKIEKLNRINVTPQASAIKEQIIEKRVISSVSAEIAKTNLPAEDISLESTKSAQIISSEEAKNSVKPTAINILEEAKNGGYEEISVLDEPLTSNKANPLPNTARTISTINRTSNTIAKGSTALAIASSTARITLRALTTILAITGALMLLALVIAIIEIIVFRILNITPIYEKYSLVYQTENIYTYGANSDSYYIETNSDNADTILQAKGRDYQAFIAAAPSDMENPWDYVFASVYRSLPEWIHYKDLSGNFISLPLLSLTSSTLTPDIKYISLNGKSYH